MSDKPLDTPFDQFTDEEVEDMTNNEIMDRGIALSELGVEGWVDGIVNQASQQIGYMMLQLKLAIIAGENPVMLANEFEIGVNQTLHAVFDTGRRLGQREGKGEV